MAHFRAIIFVHSINHLVMPRSSSSDLDEQDHSSRSECMILFIHSDQMNELNLFDQNKNLCKYLQVQKCICMCHQRTLMRCDCAGVRQSHLTGSMVPAGLVRSHNMHDSSLSHLGVQCSSDDTNCGIYHSLDHFDDSSQH